ncbi:hypothetical protein BJ742DRAFT_779384 [Cladochytrium replicatum]|nr:hypothetical protein BJ742DRAFT_779384 [Cladochytrium replicatum]
MLTQIWRSFTSLPKTSTAGVPPTSFDGVRDGDPALYLFPRSKAGTSIDPECLKIQAYLLFSGFAHATKDHLENDFSPTGRLPVLVVKGELHCGKEIVEKVKNMTSLDANLPDSERSDLEAFVALAENELHLAVMYSLWYNDVTSSETTLPIYLQRYPWPINAVIFRQERGKVVDYIVRRKGVLRKNELFAKASTALSALSEKLGSSLYFGGSGPVYADAAVFSYVHILLTALKRSSELHMEVLKHQNLVQHSKRVWDTW